MAERTKSAVDAAKEFRQELTQQHTQDLEVQAGHLCIHSVRDVTVLLGALGLGVYLGRVASLELTGWKRALPLLIGAGAIVAAKVVAPHRLRFATRSAIVVGASALALSTVHYTLQLNLDDKGAEA